MKGHSRSLTTILGIFFVTALLQGCGGEQPEPEITTLTDEQAEQEARQIREQMSLDIAEGLDVSLWGSEKLLGDPIGLHMDDEGTSWVTVTNRSRNSEFDIRGRDPHWRTASMTWETVEDRRDFLREELAPERSDENTWIPDRNEDGSHDWRDLAVVQEEVYKIKDRSGNGFADYSKLFIRDFNEEITDVAGSVLHHNDEVFVGVGPDMWRIRDTNNDGMADWKESISHGYNVHIGFSGHGMSGLEVGPDGRIYWAIGDMGFSVEDQEGKTWHYPNQGAILRSEPDGSNFEVYAAGVRNTHEFTFDKHGNLITVDNDGDYPREFERVAYLVNGSDSGWRINWQFGKYTDDRNNDYNVWMDENYFYPHWEGQAAHVLPPIAEYHAGPAGVAYNPGTALSEEWDDHFFVASFRGSTANSGIYAFTLEQDGATFELATDQQAMWGIQAVGVDFGPDGAMYFNDWVEGWGQNQQGRIWRLDATENIRSSKREEVEALLADDFSEYEEPRLHELMEHEDKRVRQNAQFELAGRGAVDELLTVLQQSDHQLARLHGIWGISQIGRLQERQAMENLHDFLDDPDSEVRAQAARMLGDVRYEPAAELLIPLLDDEAPRVRFFAAEALGRLEHQPALQPIVDMLEANDEEDVYLRHAGAIALDRIGDEEAVTGLAEHPSRAVRIAAVVALKRMEAPGAAHFLEDDDEYIVTNAARAIVDDAMLDEALPSLSAMLEQDRFMNEPLIRRAINAALYNGGQEDAVRLAQFAGRGSADETLRAEAMKTLAVWEEPSIFDRVAGRHRGQIENDPEHARQALQPVLDDLLAGSGNVVKIAAIEAAANLNYRPALPAMFTLLQDSPSAGVRIAALDAMKQMDYENIQEAVTLALEDSETEARMNALGMIPELDIADQARVELLEGVLDEGSITEKQTALATLGELESEAARDILYEQLRLLIADDLSPELRLEVVEATEKAGTDRLEQRLAEYRNMKPDEESVDAYREALQGGNAQNGLNVFVSHDAAQCVRCHAVDGQGGEVGPALTTIGDQRSREQLLESLVAPNARVAPGHGNVTLTLQDGSTVSGPLVAESNTHITLSSDGDEREIPKTEIEETRYSASGMPPMGRLLSKSELRDLVEFLTTLTEDAARARR